MAKRSLLMLIGLTFLTGYAFQSVAQYSDSRSNNPNISYFVFSPDSIHLAKVFPSQNKTKIRVLETEGMSTVAQWRIQDFQPHTIEFSPRDPNKILLADNRKLLVYEWIDGRQKLAFVQPTITNQKLIHASFDLESDEIVWATQNRIFKTNLRNKQTRKIFTTDANRDVIKSLTSLSNGLIAISLEGSSKILLFDPSRPRQPEELSGHQAPVVGVRSPQGKDLYSLDNDRELLVWNPSRRRVIRRIRLGTVGKGWEVEGIALDDPKKNLRVVYRRGREEEGRKFSLRDLSNGIVNPVKESISKTPSGNVYSTVDSISNDATEAISRPYERKRRFSPGKVSEKKSLYDLAKIEAENDNYEAALNLIKKIPLNDSKFRESRELRKKIFDQIELRNSIGVAKEQYRTGNYESAKILLDDILVKTPDNPVAKRYLSLTEDKLSPNFWIKLFLVFFILLLLAVLGFLLWKYQKEFKTLLRGVSSPNKPAGGAKKKRSAITRREFILKLDETKKKLKLAIAGDTSGQNKARWLDWAARLNMIEKRAKLDDTFLPGLDEKLEHLLWQLNKILERTPEGNERKKRASASGGTSGEERHRTADRQSSEKQTSARDREEKKNPKNYYQILGVTEKASTEEIKKAYRKKMRDYHPDKHNASDFDWIKQEADRMTKMIQEAYDVLSDPRKRNAYSP